MADDVVFGNYRKGTRLALVDFEAKGNVCRFWLGNPGARPWGDDWDDAPYEHNAGRVYDEFVAGHVDVAFDFAAIVAEPCLGELNSSWSKSDMLARTVPCLATLMVEDSYDRWRFEDSFTRTAANGHAHRFYLGDEVALGDDSWLPDYATVIGWGAGM